MPVEKKQKSENINARLQLAIKSGRYTLGFKSCRRNLRNCKSQLIIMANNVPQLRRCEVEYFAMLSRSMIYHFNGSNVELGTACGKYFPISMLTILDGGDSDIISHIQKISKAVS
ncbi:60S ribosomal protein L30 [Thelohanellus kitauei]|uniref:Large ribosomal subunit protein eL30 n=1 Tax=Thelohanellus kitauei TaxID=669202 RepID=A0A0C2MYT0_THEKT|nr:60S ribosomal protein L30 [Thelohanellus kitauei]